MTSVSGQTGKLVGRVFDRETGESLAGTNVVIESVWEFDQVVDLSDKLGAATDASGFYLILNVPPEVYNVKATMIGYIPMIQKQVHVNMNRTVTLDFPMEPTVLEMEALEVLADREIIKPDVSGSQEIITTERISETPVLRLDEFVNNIKGVELVADNDGHGLSIRGGSIRETEVRIDGISARDPRSENAYLSFNSTSIQELQVLSGGFQAKYGGFRSGLVNAITKEGTSQRYSVSFKADYTPKPDRKFFGDNPWSKDSWIYRVFADTTFTYFDPVDSMFYSFAMYGVPHDTLLPDGFPDELKSFRGWNHRSEGRNNYEKIGLPKSTRLTPEQKRRLWLIQHPVYQFANRPDAYYEGTITGPLPGNWLPLVGRILNRSTFLLSAKYDNVQFAFPLGPRSGYRDWNTQFKVTSRLAQNTKASFNFLYANVLTNTANRPSTLGGALVEYSSRFSFLSGTEQSVEQQARILGAGNGFVNMYNKSSLQFLNKRWTMAGVGLNHMFNPRTYFVVDVQFTAFDNEIAVLSADTSISAVWTMVDTFRVVKYPEVGTPFGATNLGTDLTNLFFIYGGVQQADSSRTWTLSMNGNFTAQLGRFHQVEAGFNLNLFNIFVNSGTWFQSEKMWTPGVPDTWQYYTVNPVEMGLWVQDKLEFQGLIANVGLRADYFNPRKQPFTVSHPLDSDFSSFYSLVYEYLPGQWGSWERWVEFREMLEDPPGWPKEENKVQFKLSPRLGVSFPVTAGSKLFFNYGHFYQRSNLNFLYNIAVTVDEAVIPSPDLNMARTVAYELGYEQRFLGNFLFNIALYYKDVTDEPLQRTYINYWQEFQVTRYFPDAFADIRGIEVRLEKNVGRFFTFWGNYEYMVKSRGQVGLQNVYENRILAVGESRSPNVTTSEPLPKGHLNLNFHTPLNWGPGLAGMHLLGGTYVNFLYRWEDGGEITIEEDPLTGKQLKAEVVDYSNWDLRASKTVLIGILRMEIVLTVSNVFNEKRLYLGGMSTAQYQKYKDSLHFPFEEGDQKGDDRWGDWDKEHIEVGWFNAPLFLNPRQVFLGIRFNL